MTIQEKSTALGKGVDIAEEFYQNCNLFDEQTDEVTPVWKCVRAEGAIPPTAKHNGYGNNFIYYCSFDDDKTITKTSTKAKIKVSIKAYVNGLEWIDNTPVIKSITRKK